MGKFLIQTIKEKKCIPRNVYKRCQKDVSSTQALVRNMLDDVEPMKTSGSLYNLFLGPVELLVISKFYWKWAVFMTTDRLLKKIWDLISKFGFQVLIYMVFS